jgi:hypothetical protein
MMMLPALSKGVVMTIPSAIVHEPRADRMFRWIAPVVVLIVLVASILIPGVIG